MHRKPSSWDPAGWLEWGGYLLGQAASGGPFQRFHTLVEPVGWSHRDPHRPFFQTTSETPAVPKYWPLLSPILAPAATHTGHCCIHSSLGGCISSHSNQGQGSNKKRGCLSKVSWGVQGHSQSVCSCPGDKGMEREPGRETDSALNSRWGGN